MLNTDVNGTRLWRCSGTPGLGGGWWLVRGAQNEFLSSSFVPAPASLSDAAGSRAGQIVVVFFSFFQFCESNLFLFGEKD